MMRALLLAASAATVAALCPGESPCSGHGSCGAFDKCSCYRNWQGDDCSQRTCPFATSWNTVSELSSTEPDGTKLLEHPYAECSSKGSCDRKTGMCKCFDGFDGVACRRMKCDEDCNEHGTCEVISKGNDYTGWDSAKIQSCRCDAGWEGVRCDQKKCKKGDDPLTQADFDGSSWTAQTAEVQTITVGATTTASDGETYTLTYTDWRGESWTTWPLDAYAGTVIEVKEALEALPNEAIPSVTVGGSGLSAGSGSFTVTFSSSLNTGDQQPLVEQTTGCPDNGCQPKFSGTSADISVAATTAGTTEWSVCSNRGTCNSESGDCECFSGFAGEACEIQTIIS